jgi:hypothetical protein
MAALSSYTPIATNTLTADGQTVTFSSIPATYTDLVLVINATAVSTALDISMRFNSDTASNYSRTMLMGNGTSATSGREANTTRTQINNISVITSAAGAYTGIVNIMNYANTTTNKTILSRSNNAATSGGVETIVHSWRKTPEAIHTINLFSEASRDMKAGSTFSLYGIANNTAGAKATGGVITSDSDYFYHSFYATDTFTPTQSLTCDYLVVAGGGGGANSGAGGGGGGGGHLTSIGGSPLSVTATAYTITVGAGGAGVTGNNYGGDGTNSVFSTVTATGGGGGGTSGTGTGNGRTGGSGGGGSYSGTGGTATASPAQGNAGGAGAIIASIYAGAGGGGGAGGAGAAATTGGAGGAGGAGLSSSINGTATTRAGGGGGAVDGRQAVTQGAGGSGGGGNAVAGNGVAGTTNTGGGGGGSGYNAGLGTGGSGGSGVVIIRYAR